MVDRVADRPFGRHRDEFGLHAAAGRAFRIQQDAFERAALLCRQLLEHFDLFFLGQVFKNVGRVIGIEVANALGDGFRLQLFENFFADGVIDLGQRREVEFAAQQFDKARPRVGIERFDQIAGVGFVQLAGKRLERHGVAPLDGGRNLLDDFGADRTFVVAKLNGGRLGDVLFIEHAVPPSRKD